MPQIVVKPKPRSNRPRMRGIDLDGEDQQFLIDNYYKRYKNVLEKLYKHEDDFLTKSYFQVTKSGKLDMRATKAEMRDFSFPDREHLQQYEWGTRRIKRER